MRRSYSPLLPVALAFTLHAQCGLAAGLSASQQPSSQPAGRPRGVAGFACMIDGRIPVVGIVGSSAVRVRVGVLTANRVGQIKAAVGGSFVAFHENGQDYVITDPLLVSEAVGLFEKRESAVHPQNSERPANDDSEAIPHNALKKLHDLLGRAKLGGKVRCLTLAKSVQSSPLPTDPGDDGDRSAGAGR